MNYNIEGEPLPVVICNLEANETMITEKGAMSWMTPNMKMETTSNGGIGKMFGRAFSGESMFQNRYTSMGGPGMIAFASNIIVKARNYRGLLDEIYTHTGMNFTLTNNDEVIRDIYQAVNSKIDLSKGTCVYIAGYSTYILKYNRRNVTDSFVVPYGYINLTDKY